MRFLVPLLNSNRQPKCDMFRPRRGRWGSKFAHTPDVLLLTTFFSPHNIRNHRAPPRWDCSSQNFLTFDLCSLSSHFHQSMSENDTNARSWPPVGFLRRKILVPASHVRGSYWHPLFEKHQVRIDEFLIFSAKVYISSRESSLLYPTQASFALQ